MWRPGEEAGGSVEYRKLRDWFWMGVQVWCQECEFVKREMEEGVSNGVLEAWNMGSADVELVLG